MDVVVVVVVPDLTSLMGRSFQETSSVSQLASTPFLKAKPRRMYMEKAFYRIRDKSSSYLI